MDLQCLFELSYRYSKDWQFEFNPKKCVTLSFSKKAEKAIGIKLGPHVLVNSNCETYLGTPLATDANAERNFIEKKIKSCRSMCYATQSLGTLSYPLSPNIASKLYLSACIPKLLYGVEIINVDDQSLEKLESFHANSAKLFQGLPGNACNVGSIGTIGWSSIRAKIDIMRMLFLWRILWLPMTNLYKTLLVKMIVTFMEGESYKTAKGPLAKIMSKIWCS